MVIAETIDCTFITGEKLFEYKNWKAKQRAEELEKKSKG